MPPSTLRHQPPQHAVSRVWRRPRACAQVDVLKARLKDPRVDERHTKEVLVRLIYVEMLGHDASWGHVTALRACSSKLLITKKVRCRPPGEARDSACSGGWLSRALSEMLPGSRGRRLSFLINRRHMHLIQPPSPHAPLRDDTRARHWKC